ncbi:PREDICTED: uncharacterized protein LOC105115379 isoform X1 [Populus euphratica]|uniref:Uncharacterized protein LOC105115379 isoform X1 n=1 Tax=Populus euphratica TaxID=75702 RepID=A0AAJ6X9P7_POPEU|nr:PREDICTED: uncharacterized protein LOC105115379 isoform X1 [Populus euphratica]
METPSSTKRFTRSQALAALTNTTTNNIPLSRAKIEDSSDKGETKSRRKGKQQLQDRSALIDITNDSPIVGLAMESLETPSSTLRNLKSSRAKNNIPHTPGSGEALLRGQVKTLLNKVEEEAELSKLSLGVSEMFEVEKQDCLESQKTLTRSLMLDFSEKSEGSDSLECSSELTLQGDSCGVMTSESKDKSSMTEDDNASIWSIQVNASTHDEDEEEVTIEGEEEYYYYHNEYAEVEEEEEGEQADDGGLLDELCEGISKISVTVKSMAKFEGKHTRFVYNSDDEIVEEVDCGDKDSDGVLHLKGLPTPQGKHLRFHTDEE